MFLEGRGIIGGFFLMFSIIYISHKPQKLMNKRFCLRKFMARLPSLRQVAKYKKNGVATTIKSRFLLLNFCFMYIVY